MLHQLLRVQQEEQDDDWARDSHTAIHGSLSIVDPDRLLLDLLVTLIGQSGLFAVTPFRRWGATCAAPGATDGTHLILIDPETPGVGGMRGAQKIISDYPGSKVVLFADQIRPRDAMAARQFGAWGFISKAMNPVSVSSALVLIASSEKYFHDDLVDLAKQDTPSVPYTLSGIDEDVFRLVGAGATNKEIGGVLGISEPMVKMRVRSLMLKTRCRNRTELAIHYLTELR